jgi:hypothetical protein
MTRVICDQPDTMRTLASLVLLIIALAACHERRPPVITLRGAVIRRDADPNRQAPVAGVRVVAEYSSGTAVAWSSVQGAFSLTLPAQAFQMMPITLRFRHDGYEPLDQLATLPTDLYIIRMTPLPSPARSASGGPVAAVASASVSVRYTAKAPAVADVGASVKTFQVVNRSNIPCRRPGPCSPDGRWKAATQTISLDAEQGNQFRNARLSCIAGPCPFTSIVRDNFSRGGRTINATVLNWSDTVTFLLQAEVVHPMVSETVRRSYPVIFDRTLNFSLPGSAEGVCLEAEINGTKIVFPLGPALLLSWADCHQQPDAENNRLYRCELRPGYEFH